MELAVNTALPAVAAVPRAREQESEWIDALFRQHCDRIFRYVFALVGDASAAEDVSAEVFVRAWQRRNALRDESRATAWLLAIARHLATDYVRGCVRRRQYEVPLGQFDLPPPEEVGEPASDDRIWRFFRRLTTEQQQVLYLRFVEGRPHEEVARTLGRTPGAVRAAQFEDTLAGALTSLDAAIGQVARIPIYSGEQVIAGKLTAAPLGEGLAYVVPPGMRAMAVEVNKVVAAGGNVRPGERVDVFAVIETTREDATGARQSVQQSLLLAQNVEVLAVEQRIIERAPGATSSDGTLADQPEPDPAATVVTLALPPDVALRVLLADERGAIRLAVRPAGEDATVPALAVAQDELVPLTGGGR